MENDNIKVFNINKNVHINGLNDAKFTLKLFDISGKQVIVRTQKWSGKNIISLNNISSGVYLLKVNFSKGTITKKIIIK